MKRIIILLMLSVCVPLLAIIETDEAIKLLQKSGLQEFPAADQISVENQQVELDENCLGTVEYEIFSKILTDKAKQDNKVSFWYDSNYTDLEVNIIEIIKPDGKIITLKPEKILQKNLNPYSKTMNIYSETSWVLTGEQTGLQIHAIISRQTT
ncbi:MAG TPA: hypothetical protein DHM37_04290, partial [Candidatus Cloacimonas sp.]|nr:hypothetical protein [Candidatus Cloacimonas sp.]